MFSGRFVLRNQFSSKIAKIEGIVTASIFILFILVIGFFSFFGERRAVSEAENRELAHMPEFSYDSWINGQFAGEYDNFVADSFPWRDYFLMLNANINNYFSQVSFDDEGVWIENRFLYKDRGMGHYVPVEEDIDIYADAINYVKGKLPDTDVYVLLVPAAFNLYAPERFQDPLTKADVNIKKIFSRIDNSVNKVDIYSALNNAKDEYLYFRTDYHWTARGAYCGYKVFAEKAGFQPVSLDEMRHSVVEGDFFGALIREMHEPEALKDSPDFVEVFFPQIEYTATRYVDADMTEGTPLELVRDSFDWPDKYYAFNRGDHPLIHIVTENKNGKKLMVIKDSFANAMTAFMICDFEEVFYVDYRLIEMDIFSFVEEHEIGSLMFLNKITLEKEISEFVYGINEVK